MRTLIIILILFSLFSCDEEPDMTRYEIENVQEEKTEENKFRECMEGATYATYVKRRNACRNLE
jgi:lipoprotein